MVFVYPILQSQRWRFRLVLVLLAASYIAAGLPFIDGLSSVLSTPDSTAKTTTTTTAPSTCNVVDEIGQQDESNNADDMVIREFLTPEDNNNNNNNNLLLLDRFHVHGWRWHTLSLARESGRLKSLASRMDLNDADRIKDASDYVVDFNMKGLHKIETQLFFPWMREKLTTIQQKELSSAFSNVMDRLEQDQRRVAKLGTAISMNAELACNPHKSARARAEALRVVADQSEQLERTARSMKQLEDQLLVPALAQIVPEAEQKSFSNKVLRNLGLLDSRLHLVAMYEAVNELDDMTERDLFAKSIPSIPQMMLPRWKRKLYEPRASMLG